MDVQLLMIHYTTFQITWRAVDTGCRFFQVEVVDVNADGKPDILTTCNAEKDGSLIVYEIPEDFRQVYKKAGLHVSQMILIQFTVSLSRQNDKSHIVQNITVNHNLVLHSLNMNIF